MRLKYMDYYRKKDGKINALDEDYCNEYGSSQPTNIAFENPVRIRTNNNLFLIERNGLIYQSNTEIDLWIIEQTEFIRKIRNVRTGLYMGLESLSKENNIRITAVPKIEFLINEWIFYNIAFYSGMQISNTYSDKVLDVPENSSESGVNIIQYNRKAPFLGINNQRFFVEDV